MSSSSAVEIPGTLWGKGDRSNGSRLTGIPIKVIYEDPALEVTLGCQFRSHPQTASVLGSGNTGRKRAARVKSRTPVATQAAATANSIQWGK